MIKKQGQTQVLRFAQDDNSLMMKTFNADDGFYRG